MSDSWRGLRANDLHKVTEEDVTLQVISRLAKRGLVHRVGEIQGAPVMAFTADAFDLFMDLLHLYRAQSDRSHLLHPQLRSNGMRINALATELEATICSGSKQKQRLMAEGKCDEAGLPK